MSEHNEFLGAAVAGQIVELMENGEVYVYTHEEVTALFDFFLSEKWKGMAPKELRKGYALTIKRVDHRYHVSIKKD